jgi:hypothetical protein
MVKMKFDDRGRLVMLDDEGNKRLRRMLTSK